MSNEANETISAIVAEMRDEGHTGDASCKVSYKCADCARFGCDCDAGDVDGNEDCIACDKFVATSMSQPANAAAMREALKQAERVLHCAIVAGILKGEDAHESFNAVTKALSAPPRNCDVGTVEEQSERYHVFCDSNECTSCPCKFTVRTYCALIWEQMPYEEGGAK